MFTALVPVLMLICQPAEPKPLQGTWKVTAMIEEGKSLTEKEIASNYFADGKVTIDGNVISLLPPGSFNMKTLIFTLGEEKDTKTIDLAGNAKGGSKGIYSLSGDTLLICLGKIRPTEFAAAAGTDNAMIAFKRTSAVVPKPEPAPKPIVTADIKDMIIGTWGHQDDKQLHYYTFNKDGTFSVVHEWKKGLKKVFDDDTRSSGTWKLEGDTIIMTITTSTDRERKGQIFSSKIKQISNDTVITVNQFGETHREWRVR